MNDENDRPYELVIVEAQADGGDPPKRVGLVDAVALLGRSPDVPLRIKHPTVSHEHLRLEREGRELRVTNLSRNGTTYVNGAALPTNATAPVDEANPYIQVGAFLLEAKIQDDTTPYEHILRPRGAATARLLTVHMVPGGTHATTFGEPIDLSPRPLVALAALAATPNVPVARGVLTEWLNPTGDYLNLDPLMHRVRAGLERAIEEGVMDYVRVVASMRRAGVEVPAEADPADIAKMLIRTVRGVGYVLALDPKDVAFARRHRG